MNCEAHYQTQIEFHGCNAKASKRLTDREGKTLFVCETCLGRLKRREPGWDGIWRSEENRKACFGALSGKPQAHTEADKEPS